jgi:hypothetical protein
MKNYYIYAKCPSKSMMNEPKWNASWVIRNQCIDHFTVLCAILNGSQVFGLKRGWSWPCNDRDLALMQSHTDSLSPSNDWFCCWYFQLAGQTERTNTLTCDICQIAVPQLHRHMRTRHPGCGGNSSRHGYRSDGTYTDGWFGGICGTGLSYYLLCPECRERYLAKAEEMRTLAALKGCNM